MIISSFRFDLIAAGSTRRDVITVEDDIGDDGVETSSWLFEVDEDNDGDVDNRMTRNCTIIQPTSTRKMTNFVRVP